MIEQILPKLQDESFQFQSSSYHQIQGAARPYAVSPRPADLLYLCHMSAHPLGHLKEAHSACTTS